jgi:hypothetical protein
MFSLPTLTRSEVYEVIAELEADWTRRIGAQRIRELRAILTELNEGLRGPRAR